MFAMKRFAAQQPGVDGKPLYYLIEYKVTENGDTYLYEGSVYVTNDFNKELTGDEEAFTYSFERTGTGWSVINKIKVESGLGKEMAQRIRDTFFDDLVLSGTMGFEQRESF
jgi:hypothetical protein